MDYDLDEFYVHLHLREQGYPNQTRFLDFDASSYTNVGVQGRATFRRVAEALLYRASPSASHPGLQVVCSSFWFDSQRHVST